MATTRKTDKDEDAELEDLKTKISELRSAKKQLFEKARPINEELERISLREREFIDKQNRLIAAKHDREKQKRNIQRLIELESQIERLKCENGTIKRENVACLEISSKLRRSLDQATKYSRVQKQKIAELNEKLSTEQQRHLEKAPAVSETVLSSAVEDLQKQLHETLKLLNKTTEELNGTRQSLSAVQERLTVAEQVTAATQQRELQESGTCEQLQLELTLQHQSTTPAAADTLRALYTELTTTLDARIVAVHMYQRNALTLKELQSIQSLRDRPVEAAEMLLNIIMEQPDAVYLCFLDVLKHIGQQQHVYQRLVQGGYKDYNDLSSHTSVIRDHYVFLLETLDVKFSGLVSQLYSGELLSAFEAEDITAEKTSFRANEKLLSVLSRKSPQQFQLFLDALDNCGQPHVRNVISDRTVKRKTDIPVTESVRVAAASSQTDDDVDDRKHQFLTSFREIIYQLLVHTVDVKRGGNLVDMLVTKDVLSPGERQRIKEQKRPDVRVHILLMSLREKSPAQFESFLISLRETGRQPVADVVRQALHTVGQTGQNPLRIFDVGEVVRTLPEGDRVCGVASLGEEIYVLRWKGRAEIEVYDVITYLQLRSLPVPNTAGEMIGLTACEHYRCLYACDLKYVHRLDVRSTATRWPVNDIPRSLSVNPAHNVLVTCNQFRKIKEFTSRGYLLRELSLPEEVATPWHSVVSSSGQFIVCHGHLYGPIHRVCTLTAEGRHILQSHGGQMGSDYGQYHVPRHLAIDSNESVFVLDILNRRVTLLSPTLEYLREVVSPHQLKWWPYRMSLDVRRRRLYVTDNEFEDGHYTSGRVVVFSV